MIPHPLSHFALVPCSRRRGRDGRHVRRRGRRRHHQPVGERRHRCDREPGHDRLELSHCRYLGAAQLIVLFRLGTPRIRTLISLNWVSISALLNSGSLLLLGAVHTRAIYISAPLNSNRSPSPLILRTLASHLDTRSAPIISALLIITHFQSQISTIPNYFRSPISTSPSRRLASLAWVTEHITEDGGRPSTTELNLHVGVMLCFLVSMSGFHLKLHSAWQPVNSVQNYGDVKLWGSVNVSWYIWANGGLAERCPRWFCQRGRSTSFGTFTPQLSCDGRWLCFPSRARTTLRNIHSFMCYSQEFIALWITLCVT